MWKKITEMCLKVQWGFDVNTNVKANEYWESLCREAYPICILYTPSKTILYAKLLEFSAANSGEIKNISKYAKLMEIVLNEFSPDHSKNSKLP